MYTYGRKGTLIWRSSVDGQAAKVRLFHLGGGGGGGGEQCGARTKMVHPITLKKKKSKKKSYRTPLLTNMDKRAKRGVTASPGSP